MSSSRLAQLSVSQKWANKNRSLSDLCANYSPANWHYLPALGDEVYTRECPALGSLPELYGMPSAAEQWIDEQVTGLFLSSASRDTEQMRTISIFASNFAESVRSYKLTELMLFFSRYKAGCYDNSYSAFDSRRIGLAFHKEFVPERNRALDRIEQRRAAERRNAAQSSGISRDEWLRTTVFKQAVLIHRDSPQLRADLGIDPEAPATDKVISTLHKDHVEQLGIYQRRGDITVL